MSAKDLIKQIAKETKREPAEYQKHIETLENQWIDIEQLRGLTDGDFKEIGIPIGLGIQLRRKLNGGNEGKMTVKNLMDQCAAEMKRNPSDFEKFTVKFREQWVDTDEDLKSVLPMDGQETNKACDEFFQQLKQLGMTMGLRKTLCEKLKPLRSNTTESVSAETPGAKQRSQLSFSEEESKSPQSKVPPLRLPLNMQNSQSFRLQDSARIQMFPPPTTTKDLLEKCFGEKWEDTRAYKTLAKKFSTIQDLQSNDAQEYLDKLEVSERELIKKELEQMQFDQPSPALSERPLQRQHGLKPKDDSFQIEYQQPKDRSSAASLSQEQKMAPKKQKKEMIFGPNWTKPENPDSDPDIELIRSAMKNLGLKGYLDKKQARLCTGTQIIERCHEGQNRDQEMFYQLLHQSPLALDLKFKKLPTEKKGYRHPDEIKLDIYFASTDETREMLAESLHNSNRAIPFIIPYKSKPQMIVWQLTGIKREWRVGPDQEHIRNERVYKHRHPIVSFVKLGKVKVSKSETVNRTLFKDSNRVFMEHAQTARMEPRKNSIGLVDLAFAGPELRDNKEKTPDMPDLLTVLNLHGDALLSPLKETQFEFLRKVSDVIVVFAESNEKLKEAGFTESDPPILVMHNFEKVTELKPKSTDLSWKQYGGMIGDHQFQQVRSRINTLLEENRPSENWKSLEQVAEEYTDDKMYVDFKAQPLQEAKCEAEEIFSDIVIFCKVQKLLSIDPKLTEASAKAKIWNFYFKEDSVEEAAKFFEMPNTSLLKLAREKRSGQLTQKKLEEILRSFDDVRAITGIPDLEITLGGSRQLILPLQNYDYSGKYAEIFKKEKREKDGKKEQEYKEEAEKLKQKIQKIIDEKVAPEESFIRKFIKKLVDKRRAEDRMHNDRFLDYFGYLLDSVSEEEMSKLRDDFRTISIEIRNKEQEIIESNGPEKEDKRKERSELKKIEQQITTRINKENFGREHFFREIGLIYQFGLDEQRETLGLNEYTKTVADLMIRGYAIELMDGDHSIIWTEWIEVVLSELSKQIGEFLEKDEPRGIAISIMGIQSSGKSTMLNSMFNSKFAVAAGRCTKGIYMLPVIIGPELRQKFDNKFDFVLLFDTEGLRAMELGIGNDNRIKDNEMATTSISVADVTLINSMRMMNTELYELLGIVTHAILKFQKQDKNMKDSFKVSGIFVNHGIEPDKQLNLEVGIRSRENYLDEMVKTCAAEEHFPPDKIQSMNFNSVMKRNIPEQFVPPLFSDSGNRKRYSLGYVNYCHKVRLAALIKNSKEGGTLDRLFKKIKQAYICIVQDDYTFSFKNVQELAARQLAQVELGNLKGLFIADIQVKIMTYHNVKGKKEEYKEQMDHDLKKKEEEIQMEYAKRFTKWFNDKQTKMPELATQQDEFIKKLEDQIKTEFEKQKTRYLENLAANKRIDGIKSSFTKWQNELSEHMIELHKQGKLPEFEILWNEQIEKKKEELTKEMKDKNKNMDEIFEKDFTHHFEQGQREALKILRNSEVLTDFLGKERPEKKEDLWAELEEKLKVLVPLASEITDDGTEEELQAQTKSRSALFNELRNMIDSMDSIEAKVKAQEESSNVILAKLLAEFDSKCKDHAESYYQSPKPEFYPFVAKYIFKEVLQKLKSKEQQAVDGVIEEIQKNQKSIQNQYDSIKEGLKTEERLIMDFQDEFKRYEVPILNQKLDFYNFKLKAFINSLGSQVIPREKANYIFAFMQMILNRKIEEDARRKAGEQDEFNDLQGENCRKIVSLFSSFTEEQKKFIEERLIHIWEKKLTDNVKILVKIQEKFKQLGSDKQLMNFENMKSANPFSLELVLQFVDCWQELLSARENKYNEWQTYLKSDKALKKDQEDHKNWKENVRLSLTDWVDGMKSKFNQPVEQDFAFAKFDFGFENNIRQTIKSAVENDQVNDIIRGVTQVKLKLVEIAFTILEKLPVFDKDDQKEKLIGSMVEQVMKEIKGCSERCPLCGIQCTEKHENPQNPGPHKSQFHSFPAINGFEEEGNVGNNSKTCESIMYKNQQIKQEKKIFTAQEFFASKHWEVEGKPDLQAENQSAFGKWALIRYQRYLTNRYHYVTFSDQSLVMPAVKDMTEAACDKRKRIDDEEDKIFKKVQAFVANERLTFKMDI